MTILDRQDFQALQSSDFPETKFFVHLSKGTEFFHQKEFEKAISEWEMAVKLQPDPAAMKRLPRSAAFRSSLDDVPLVCLLYAVSSNAQTGVAIVRSEYAHKEIFFKDGYIIFARTTKSEERIGNYLLKSNLITPLSLEVMAAQAKKNGVKLGKFLVMKEVLLEKELLDLLELQIQEILSDLLSWVDGDFYFTEREVDDDDVIVRYAPLDVALFAAKMTLNFVIFRKKFPHNNIILSVHPSVFKNREEIMNKLDANEEFLFSLIDGNRSIDQLIKFSGNDEISVINILYRLAHNGWIEKLRDVDTHKDKELEEIMGFLRTFSEVFRLVVDGLARELGAGIKEVLDNAWEGMELEYRNLFDGIPIDRDTPPDERKILENLSFYYPDLPDRLIVIDGFCMLISNILKEMNRIVGTTMTQKVLSDIDKIRLDIFRAYPDSPVKKRVLDACDAMVVQVSLE